MDFKQKAEEKKMSMSKNIARLAVTAGLTAALSFGGVMAPVTMAFAEGKPVATENGSVTIKEDIYTNTTFKGIQIFKATVTQNQKSEGVWDSTGDKTLSDIEWANESVMNAVTSAFNADEPKPAGFPTGTDAKSAQAWAQFINQHRSEVTGENVNAGSVLDKIAKALEDQTWTDAKAGTTGTFESIAAGYWLFETKSVGTTTGADGNKDAYTSPIFAVVGGSDVNVTPKKSVPNVTKAVMDDKDQTFVTDASKNVFTAANKAADSAAEQPVAYQLAGSVASNINTYDKYSYTFTDELPTTMEPVLGKDGKPAVVVKIGETVVKSDCYSVNYAPVEGKNTLAVSFEDLKAAKDTDGNLITVDGSSKVYVNYQAKLVASKITADMLGKAQVNNVKLTYSNNPHTNGTGTTVVHSAYDYTYGIDVTKVGSDDETKGLEGVEFTLQEVVGGNAEDQFIDAKGVKHGDAKDATLKTTAEGKINVVGLDEGTYILKEVTPAPGYNNSAKDGVTFTIKRGSSELYQAGSDVIPSTDSAIVATGGLVKDNAANASTGKLSFTIVDQKGSGLPLTGLNGVTFTWIAGSAVLCIGVAHLIRSRKQAEESEQE